MTNLLIDTLISKGLDPVLATIIAICAALGAIIIVSWLAYHIARTYLVRLARLTISKVKPKWGHSFTRNRVFTRLSQLAPTLVVYYLAPLLLTTDSTLTVHLTSAVRALSMVYLIVIITLTLSALLSTIEDVYRGFKVAKQRPIKSYIQVAKIFLFCISSILIISTAFNKSPLALLTGLGALTAIIILIFKDSILGFVSSIQISVYDMVRIGDWIEVPKYGVNGDVIDMSLNTIKIQNFDKTIVTIPSYAILSEGVKNWRGMTESGGRRIKRSINIDLDTIKFCNEEMLQRFSKIAYITDYIKEKTIEIHHHNMSLKHDMTLLANGRHLTNIGVFRAYLNAYLQNHPDIHQKMTFIVRQLQPAETGLPIELYIFTNDTDWVHYEAIQSDIFDHILAVIPEFDLRAFQKLTQKISLQLDPSSKKLLSA